MREAMRSGWKCSSSSSFSPVAAKAIGLADDLFDRERRTTAGIAVELGQDHAVERKLLVERLGHVDRVLAGHRIDDEERVVRRDGFRDQPDLFHQRFVNGKAAGGINNDHVASEASCFSDGVASYFNRSGCLAINGHVDLPAKGTELFDGGRTLEVGTNEERIAALGLEPFGQLA